MLYTERYTYYYASLKIACQMEVRKAGQTVGKYWLSIGFIGLVIGYIYPITGGAAKDTIFEGLYNI
jgi:hypothetical protein